MTNLLDILNTVMLMNINFWLTMIYLELKRQRPPQYNHRDQ